MDKKISPQEAAIAVLKKAEEMLAKAAPKLKLSGDHDKNSHLYEGDKGTSKMGSQVRGANRSKSWAKDDRSSSPKIEQKMAKDKMVAAKTSAKANLASTKEMPKPNLTKSQNVAVPPQEKDVTPADGVIAEPQAAPPSGKGVHKLAKFMGARDEKRKSKVNGNPGGDPVKMPVQGTAAPLEKGDNDGAHSSNHTNNYHDAMKTKGVNKVLPKYDKETSSVKHGSSEMGHQVENKKIGAAKATAKSTLAELKRQPKPKLTKGEDGK